MDSCFLRAALLLIVLSSLLSCSTFPAQQAWKSTPGALDRGLTIERGPSSADSASVRIFGGPLEGAVLSGMARLAPDEVDIYLEEMHWFSNWSNGWTEARLPASGEMRLRRNEEDWVISVVTAPQLAEPSSASIRDGDEYLAGPRGVELFARRWARIRAVIALLKQKLPDQWFEPLSFQEAAGRFLFPEIYGYSVAPNPGYRTARAESITWNVDYTEANFPDNLREIRDTGTMLRDFEECPALWRLAFRWDELWRHRIEAVSIAQTMKSDR